jgi:hypothetical protein
MNYFDIHALCLGNDTSSLLRVATQQPEEVMNLACERYLSDVVLLLSQHGLGNMLSACVYACEMHNLQIYQFASKHVSLEYLRSYIMVQAAQHAFLPALHDIFERTKNLQGYAGPMIQEQFNLACESKRYLLASVLALKGGASIPINFKFGHIAPLLDCNFPADKFTHLHQVYHAQRLVAHQKRSTWELADCLFQASQPSTPPSQLSTLSSQPSSPSFQLPTVLSALVADYATPTCSEIQSHLLNQHRVTEDYLNPGKDLEVQILPNYFRVPATWDIGTLRDYLQVIWFKMHPRLQFGPYSFHLTGENNQLWPETTLLRNLYPSLKFKQKFHFGRPHLESTPPSTSTS